MLGCVAAVAGLTEMEQKADWPKLWKEADQQPHSVLQMTFMMDKRAEIFNCSHNIFRRFGDPIFSTQQTWEPTRMREGFVIEISIEMEDGGWRRVHYMRSYSRNFLLSTFWKWNRTSGLDTQYSLALFSVLMKRAGTRASLDIHRPGRFSWRIWRTWKTCSLPGLMLQEMVVWERLQLSWRLMKRFWR